MDHIEPAIESVGGLNVLYPITTPILITSGSLAFIGWFFSTLKYDDDRCQHWKKTRVGHWQERNSYICWSNKTSQYNKIEM